MKSLILISACLLAACSFDPSGAPGDGSDDDDGIDAGDLGIDAVLDTPDADPGTPSASIICSTTVIDGYPKVVLTFGGDIEAALLGDPSGAEPVKIAYGSDQEDLAVRNSCTGTWDVPYQPAGCNKPTAAWGEAPQLILEPEVDRLNVALIYDDGTVRWGDLKTSDGDAVGFTVTTDDGAAPELGLDCHVEVSADGTGGTIRTKP